MKKEIYLDNAATAPLHEEVKKTILHVLENHYGNSSSLHSKGVEASKKVEAAREVIAHSLKARAEEIYFTSGGTESNNWVMQSRLFSSKDHQRKKVLTSSVEHPSVLLPLEKWAKESGLEVQKIGVDRFGIIKMDEFKTALDTSVALCSVMHVNNETGSLQPIEEIAHLCQHVGSPLHVDACQSYMKEAIDLSKVPVTYLTINSHKIHGPKGIGALYMRSGLELGPVMLGGGHELNRRSGTLNVAGIAGFGRAVELQLDQKGLFKTRALLDYFSTLLKNECPQCEVNGHSLKRAPHILNVRFKNYSGKDIFWALNRAGIFISTSSACSSNKNTPSHVLAAMGLSDQENLESVRFSLGLLNTKEEIENVIKTLKEIIK